MIKMISKKLTEEDLVPPSRSYLEITFVGETATGKGNNEQFAMNNLNDGTFEVIKGRVNIRVGPNKARKTIYAIDEWDEIYANKIKSYGSKLRNGSISVKDTKVEKKTITKSGLTVNGSTYSEIQDKEVNKIVNRLLEFANAMMSASYTVKVDDISPEMIALGKEILDTLAAGYEQMSVAEFNGKVKTLYAAIPRRIDSLSKQLCHRKVEFQDFLAKEQDLFDIMISQVQSQENLKNSKINPTILDAYGMTWRKVTNDEAEYIKNKLGQERGHYVNAWRITNAKTEKAFNDYCKQENLTEQSGISHLFHGSRNENFFSIVTTGLNINPSNVVITGKMYGNGTYFAPSANKSMGYTSRYGSRWANGSTNSGFLGIYKVATGKCYTPGGSDSSLNWKKLQSKCPGAHCTWAHAGSDTGLLRDEVIVYQNQQSTVEYLVEISC